MENSMWPYREEFKTHRGDAEIAEKTMQNDDVLEVRNLEDSR